MQAVKCLTMMGLVNKRVGRLKAATECAAKEVRGLTLVNLKSRALFLVQI